MEVIAADLIFTVPNHIPTSLCNDIMLRFERDPRKTKGLVNNKIDETFKSNIELLISSLAEWKDVDALLFDSLQSGYIKYMDHISKINKKTPIFANVKDKGYVIEKYPAYTGFHKCHTDFGIYVDDPTNIESRIIGFKWCLTNSILGAKGSLLFYPTIWPLVYEIQQNENDEYYVTGFMVMSANQSK